MPEACSQFRSYEAAGERAFRWRISRVAPRIPGDSPRASFPRPFRPHESGRSIGVVPGLHIGFTGFHLRIPGILPGLHSRGLSGRRRAGVSVADFPGLHLGFTGFHLRIPGILPGLHSRGLSGRRRCAAVSGSRGFSPGFIPAAIQAAGELRRSFVLPGRKAGLGGGADSCLVGAERAKLRARFRFGAGKIGTFRAIRFDGVIRSGMAEIFAGPRFSRAGI